MRRQNPSEERRSCSRAGKGSYTIVTETFDSLPRQSCRCTCADPRGEGHADVDVRRVNRWLVSGSPPNRWRATLFPASRPPLDKEPVTAAKAAPRADHTASQVLRIGSIEAFAEGSLYVCSAQTIRRCAVWCREPSAMRAAILLRTGRCSQAQSDDRRIRLRAPGPAAFACELSPDRSLDISCSRVC